jgi:hypothetical protein
MTTLFPRQVSTRKLIRLPWFAFPLVFLFWAQAVLADTVIPHNQIPAILKWESIKQNKPHISQERFESLYGKNATYTASQIKEYLASEAAVIAPSTAPEQTVVYQGPKEFPWVRLRRSYRDVLTLEDPSLSLENQKGKATFDDIDGALVSYSRDFRKDTETWSTEAALLAPFSWVVSHTLRNQDFLVPARFGIIPSVSYHRVSTSGSSKGEVDQLVYRAGLFAKFESGNDFEFLNGLTLRAFGSFATDAIHHSSVPAGEFDVEPQSDVSPTLKIGYRTILVPKENPADIHDTAWIAYQLRVLLHGEYVSIQNNGGNTAVAEGDYFRLGPVVQFDLKPLIFTRLSASLRYSYLPALNNGKSGHESLFGIDGDWTLFKDAANGRKLSLKISYLNGGLDLTKEPVQTLLIGMGAAF